MCIFCVVKHHARIIDRICFLYDQKQSKYLLKKKKPRQLLPINFLEFLFLKTAANRTITYGCHSESFCFLLIEMHAVTCYRNLGNNLPLVLPEEDCFRYSNCTKFIKPIRLHSYRYQHLFSRLEFHNQVSVGQMYQLPFLQAQHVRKFDNTAQDALDSVVGF